MGTGKWPKAFLVDLDNTLHDYRKASQSARFTLANKIEELHDGVSREQILARYEHLLKEEEEIIHASGRELRLKRITRLLNTWPQTRSSAAEPLMELFEDALLNAVHPFEGALTSFHQLKARARTIVVTEGYGDIQTAIASRIGISVHDREFLATYAHGVRKFDGSAYRLARDWLELQTDDIVMIGDNWVWDILASSQAGMWQLWVRGDEPVRGQPMDRHLGSVEFFRDVPSLMTKWWDGAKPELGELGYWGFQS